MRRIVLIIVLLCAGGILSYLHTRTRILIISPFTLDDHHTSSIPLSLQYNVLTTELRPTIQESIEQSLPHVDGITSCRDYEGNIVASILAHKHGLPGPDPKAVLTCQHKYYSRLAQQQYVPEAVPRFQLIDPNNIDVQLEFPLFIKPVKSYFSMNAQQVDSLHELQSLQLMPSREFLEPINQALKLYGYPLSANYLIAEEILSGDQVTLEGYVYKGKLHILGITDSIMYPGTMTFKQFLYPSLLPSSVQARMGDIATRFMKGIGFDNSFFNIEFFYNPQEDSIKIIEVNPRSVAQFADLYERVDGTNSYQYLLDLATGKEPQPTQREGRFKYAASCALRIFEDRFVSKVPTLIERCSARSAVPDAYIRIFAQQGKKLSDTIQDGKSYFYALINLGGDSPDDIERRLDLCKERLPFELIPLTAA